MSNFQTIIAILATIALFLHGLEEFSKEVKELGSDYFKTLISRITKNKYGGLLLGIFLTALIQSSSAVSSITVALVDASVISFGKSLAVMLGANVGTTSTAWLVTLKVGQIAPLFIVLGSAVSIIPARIQTAGKSIFYFGLILFSLELISQALAPLGKSATIGVFLAHADIHIIGIIAGILITAFVQSSSVTTGLSIILAEQGILSTEGAIAIIIGSNLGTTSTALLASLKMTPSAKLAAKANFIFNALGILICFPFITSIDQFVRLITDEIGFQVAFAHLIFNLIILAIMLPFIEQFGHWLWNRQDISKIDTH